VPFAMSFRTQASFLGEPTAGEASDYHGYRYLLAEGLSIELRTMKNGWPRRFSVPSFTGFMPASAASSHAKRRNASASTQPEIILCKALTAAGLRYQRNVASIPGKPDVVFSRLRIAIFCDGDFWHGRTWARLKRQLERRANADYWIPKIAANRARDARTRRALTRAGWLVIRVWETDLKRDSTGIATDIRRTVARHRRVQ
jgi:DNA mismatch endonuclease, patch repair protein